MDAHEIRRLNLLFWANKIGRKDLSHKLGYPDENYINLVLAGHSKAGSRSPRKWEKKLSLDDGWFDRIHDDEGKNDSANFSSTIQSVNVVPLISFVSAGDMCETVDPYPVGDAERMVNSPVDVSPGMYALEVRGDSMKNPVGIPTFPDGYIIIVNPNLQPKSGDFVIAKDGDGQANFKKLSIDGDDAYLVPLNPEFKTKKIEHELHICGVVVSVHMDLR